MQIKLDQLSIPQTYFMMTQTVLPRPIAWILSENDDKGFNLAPFSYFNAVCSDPPLVMVSIGIKDDGSEKDTLRNIKARSQFVIHIASGSQLTELNQTSANLPPGVSEVSENRLQTTAVDGFHMPRLSDCKIALMCERYEIQTLGNSQQSLLFGEIKEMYIDDDCVEFNEKGRLKVLTGKVQPLSRLGASEYAGFGEILVAKRPE